MAFKTPLRHRCREADQRRERYRTDPAYRLRRINYSRKDIGMPLLSSADEIPDLALSAAAQSRDERGRFQA